MLETSRDILNLSIAVAVIALVVFLCWTLYYLISNLKRINRISQKIESGVTKVDGLVDLIKSKVKQSSSYLFLFSKLADKAMDYFSHRSKEKKENKEDKKKKDE